MVATLVLSPLLLTAYGLVQWIDGADGEYGPGPAWTAGHLLFLAGFLLFAVVLVTIRRMVISARLVASIALVAGLLGVLSFVRIIMIDLLVALRSSDHQMMSDLRDAYDRWPGDLGVYDALYPVGPLLFLCGLHALMVLLVLQGRLPLWSPAVLVLGVSAIVAGLNLMPLSGALILASLVPLLQSARAQHKAPSEAS
ncbi:hypothetical protein [Streptomyces sp. SID13031]|uniref:hypothetical protein n=1 Tax=Streptomyces sp. SID13031 TaxID=2706046 RepID=UPI0013C85E1A|nr:hypothetical protein [Streptomyces sp. SID13031]NEA31292.1 hypothetical protein [Streptomyces sp. SID13031]